MTHPDFNALYRHIDARFDALDSFDEIYFIGHHSHSFSMRALSIARALPNFAGIAIFPAAPEKRVQMAQRLPAGLNWNFIELRTLPERARVKRVLLLDFNDTLAGMQIARELARQGVPVRDLIFAMHQLDLTHTYQTVKEERNHFATNLGAFIALADRFDDPISRRTLFARLEAYLTLERRPLTVAAFPLGDFMNNFSTQAGLKVGADDIFIDAGAAHGDSVAHFFDIARGQYRAMHAFEPDATNFAALANLAAHLPHVHPYLAGLGEKDSEVDFYEHPDNRFGSNFTGGGIKTTMKIMAIDSVVDAATVIKIDVEGWEARVLRGGARTIAACKPDMTISAYHYARDIPELLATVEDIARYRHVALRHYSSNLYDTQLVFSDRQDFH
jgi:FkbM family methyltransferase